MSMYDKPAYLTGTDGFVNVGDTFYLHNAKLDGQTTIGGTPRDQVKLLVSHEQDGPRVIVYASGVAIVGQIKRMDADDRASLPHHLRLDEIPATQAGRNATKVMTPADQPPPAAADGFGGGTDADF